MACVSWLLVLAFSPVVGALGWDTSLYDDLSSKDRLLDCMGLCTSTFQRARQSNNEVAPLSLDLLLANLSDGKKILEPEPVVSKDKRRSYSMEHFRWGKPPGRPVRQRRPVKVYGPEDGDGESSEGSSPQPARQQLRRTDDEGQGRLELRRADDQEEEVQTTWGRFDRRLAPPLPGPQENRDGKYQMGHFRWGRPPAKRHSGAPQRSLLELLRNIMVEDAK